MCVTMYGTYDEVCGAIWSVWCLVAVIMAFNCAAEGEGGGGEGNVRVLTTLK